MQKEAAGDDYGDLGSAAVKLRELVGNQARRPYVLEVTGTPKAGKSTTILLLESFFKACGWRVHVVRERAAQCPIAMKGHFFFNSWTTSTMLAEVIEAVDRPVDLIILDRGFFDSLVWLELQQERRQVTEEEAKTFVNFVLLDRWRSLVDAVVVMSVTPEIALEREKKGLLVPRKGSVMNQQALQSFNAALDRAVKLHGGRFDLVPIDSKTEDAKTVAATIVGELSRRIEAWVDPQIAVVPRSVAEELFSGEIALRWSNANREVIERGLSARQRSHAEADATVVQLVSCGVPVSGDGVFVFDRARDEKRVGEYGRHSLWSGQHVDWAEGPMENAARRALLDRMQRDLHLRLELEPEPIGFTWSPNPQGSPQDAPSSERSAKHLGVFFRVRIEDDAVRQSLEDKEFKTRGRGHSATSRFNSLVELRDATLDLEPWSKAVVEQEWLAA